MKKGILFSCLLFLASVVYSQNFVVDNYERFIEQDNSTVVHVASATFRIAANVVPDDEEEARAIKDFVESIQSFDLVAVPDLENAREQYNAGVRKIDGSFEELMNIKESDGRFSLFIDESGGVVHELVGIGTDQEEFIVFSLLGEMDLDLIGQFVGKIQSENLAPLKKIAAYSITDVKVYPNPATVDGEITIELPEGMVGAEAQLVDVNGSVIKTFEVNSRAQSINTNGLKPGYYFVHLTKDEINMKKKVLVIQ